LIRSPASYEIYGLVVRSPLALTARNAPHGMPVDVRLRAGRPARFAHLRQQLDIDSASDWFHSRRLPNGSTYLRWSGLFEFLISADGRSIEYYRLPRASYESLNTYLLGQVLSSSLLSLGVETLHATATVVDGGAVAFVGDCGLGKSTLGAAFLSRGFPILTDDLLALTPRGDQWFAEPGPPRLKLFPSVATRLLGRSAPAVLLNPWTSKLVLKLTAAESAAAAAPLRALFILSAPGARGSRQSRLSVKRLAGQRAFLEVIRATFNLMQIDRRRLENQFSIAARVATSVPIYRLTYPRQLSSLDEVCGAVLAAATAQRQCLISSSRTTRRPAAAHSA
jgi:hypothetical protein